MSTDHVEVVSATEPVVAPPPVVEPKPIEKEAESKSAPESEDSSETTEDSETLENESESEESDADDKSEEGEKNEDKPKKKSGFKRRIDKLNAKASAAQQEVEYWKAQALKSAQPNQEPVQQKQSSPPSDDRPKSESFDSHDAYVDALTEWKVDQKFKANEQKAKEAQIRSEFQKQQTSFADKVSSFKENHADFDEYIADVDDVPMSVTVQSVILDSDNGPELMYELAKNREEYERICKLPAIAAAVELGKIKAKLAKATDVVKEPKTTKAPPPINPVNAKSATPVKSLEDMDYDEFKKYRDEQRKRR